MLAFSVSAGGSVKNIVVTRSSGFPGLDEAAVKCVAQFRCGRVTQNGRTVEYDRQTNMNWRLQ